ncbi:MAG TPA: DUF1674 domain-containing protein [Acetobacteraceae bacterium]|nr:DUF1674 domain-containing protein [Acetobacteraceae bacterium]
MSKSENVPPTALPPAASGPPAVPPPPEGSKAGAPKEIGGPPGPEPTRYGDWQYKGRCTDF